MKVLNLLGIRKRTILGRSDTQVVVMEALTDEQVKVMEEEQKDKGTASYKSGKDTIPSYDVLLFGKIDFNNKSDVKLIKRFEGRIWDIMSPEHFIETNFDYKKGKVYSDNKNEFKGYTCTNIVDWLKYNHVMINKPSNIIIYKYPRGKFMLRCPYFYRGK